MHSQPVEITPRAADAPSTPVVGGCGCGHEDATDVVLDARAIPHAVRHAAVLGAVGAIGVGEALVLVAPHDPVRLLAQIAAAHPDAFEVSYLERGPEAWHVRLARMA